MVKLRRIFTFILHFIHFHFYALKLLPGLLDELAPADGPGAVPTLGAGMFWHGGGSYASIQIEIIIKIFTFH